MIEMIETDILRYLCSVVSLIQFYIHGWGRIVEAQNNPMIIRVHTRCCPQALWIEPNKHG